MSTEELEAKVQQLIDNQEKILRRVDILNKQLDTLDSDRQIFENIQGRLTSVEEQLKMSRQHDMQVKKAIKEEVQLSGDRVKASVESMVEEIKDVAKRKRRTSNKSILNFLRR